jgi:DNA polymerase-3 subunit beta
MKFSVLSGDLLKILVKTGSVIPTRSTMPVLENYLFELKEDALTITATDIDISVSSSISVKGEQNGSIVVPSKRLMETIRALPNINVKFTAEVVSNKIMMLTDKGEYRLTGLPSEEYPTTPRVKSDEEILISTDLLKRSINKTIFAASTDELRPAMTGVLFQMKKEELRVVATDGHRLVRIINTGFKTQKSEYDIIIPAKTLNIISKYFEEKLNSAYLDGSHIMFNFENSVLVSRIIDEKYPNYETVIPLDNNKVLSVNRNEIISSVRRASFYASSSTHQVKFSILKDSVTISAEDIDFGSEAKETLGCEFSDNELEIGFNAAYINDILSHIDSEEIEFLLSSPNRAAMVKPKQQQENEDILMLVMPVRLNS